MATTTTSSGETSMAPVAIVFISFLAFPMMYIVNSAQDVHGEFGLFVSGTICLAVILFLTGLAALQQRRTSGQWDWLLFVFALGTFASAVDLIIGLEADGYIKGFMGVYLKSGEPYLATPYGSLISYWDGTAHYIMYIVMLVSMSFKWNYRPVGLYWAGSIGHSMLVLIPGAVVGKFGVRWSFLLNVPYIFIPFMSAARFLNERPPHPTNEQRINRGGVLRRTVDLVLITSLHASGAIAVLRGFAVLGCRHTIAVNYLKYYEPYLNDPVAFPKVQMLIYLFYFLPFYIMAIYGLHCGGKTWLSDWAIIFAGASANAQVPHILGSLHQRTSVEYRLPPSNSSLSGSDLTVSGIMMTFWAINILLLIVPQLLAIHCSTSEGSDVCKVQQSDRQQDHDDVPQQKQSKKQSEKRQSPKTVKSKQT